MFNWLFGRRRESVTHQVWINRAAKLAGIRNAVDCRLDSSQALDALIVVAFFDDTLTELQSAVTRRDRRLEIVSFADLQRRHRRMPEALRLVCLLIADLHPDISRDEQLREVARDFDCRVEIEFHTSLDDAVMREFAGEWVPSMLKQLGMKDNESISHPMVTRQIQAARKKLAACIVSDHPADSASAWIDRNCRSA